MNNYQRNLMRLRGFCDGAGSKGINPDYESDADYMKGWYDGDKAKHDYGTATAEELGVKLNQIVALRS